MGRIPLLTQKYEKKLRQNLINGRLARRGTSLLRNFICQLIDNCVFKYFHSIEVAMVSVIVAIFLNK